MEAPRITTVFLVCGPVAVPPPAIGSQALPVQRQVALAVPPPEQLPRERASVTTKPAPVGAETGALAKVAAGGIHLRLESLRVPLVVRFSRFWPKQVEIA